MQQEIMRELDRAHQARAHGLEGKARVCARRAAGWAAQAYLTRFHPENAPTVALIALQTLSTLPGFSPQFYLWAQHLTMRVDENYALPPEVDLLAEANLFVISLHERINA